MTADARAVIDAMHAARWAREKLVRAVMELALAERTAGASGGAVRLLRAEHVFDLAVRDCFRAISDLPADRQPDGWEERP